MTETKGITEWTILPILLGVESSDVERIKMDNRGEAFYQQQAIIRAWLGNGKASWAILVSALRDSIVRKAGFGNQIASNHPS